MSHINTPMRHAYCLLRPWHALSIILPQRINKRRRTTKLLSKVLPIHQRHIRPIPRKRTHSMITIPYKHHLPALPITIDVRKRLLIPRIKNHHYRQISRIHQRLKRRRNRPATV
jgi:hypothetical protein